jgi:hypothetical protein
LLHTHTLIPLHHVPLKPPLPHTLILFRRITTIRPSVRPSVRCRPPAAIIILPSLLVIHTFAIFLFPRPPPAPAPKSMIDPSLVVFCRKPNTNKLTNNVQCIPLHRYRQQQQVCSSFRLFFSLCLSLSRFLCLSFSYHFCSLCCCFGYMSRR